MKKIVICLALLVVALWWVAFLSYRAVVAIKALGFEDVKAQPGVVILTVNVDATTTTDCPVTLTYHLDGTVTYQGVVVKLEDDVAARVDCGVG